MPDNNSDWSLFEVEAVVADYLEMFEKELRREPYNKAEHNRQLQKLLPRRGRGSIEFKHQNISAVLLDLRRPYISGYKPRKNYQDLLFDVVESRLDERPDLARLIQVEIERPADIPDVDDILQRLVDPPREERSNKYRERRHRRSPQPIDYLLLEARKTELGRAGELFVIRYEIARLISEGKEGLAAKVEHVSVTRGDHEGFDVLSFQGDGREKLIEVKTTSFGDMTPFFVSRNQVDLSEKESDRFFLHRVYRFRDDPRFFALPGSLPSTCDLDPSEYSATPVS